MVESWCDGSVGPSNPSTKGGFSVVFVKDDEVIKTISKGYIEDKAILTNNQMELKGILCAMCWSILRQGCARIHSDSAYAINCISKWAPGWEQRGWLKGDGTIPENLELIQEAYKIYSKYPVELIKTKGHKDDKYNNLADRLAGESYG